MNEEAQLAWQIVETTDTSFFSPVGRGRERLPFAQSEGAHV